MASESEEAAETEEITAPLEEEILEKEVFEEVIPLEIEDSDGDTVAEPEESLETEEEYDAIVLVPAEDFPPVVDEPEVSVLPVEEIIPLEEMAEEKNADVVPEKINETVSEFVPEKEVKAENIISTSEDFSEYTVGSLSDLKSGAYYIQIAVYKDSANISEIISKYGSHYPNTLVPLKSGSAKQILIGPLSVDEYGTVLARFKANGFKDAFLRKIK